MGITKSERHNRMMERAFAKARKSGDLDPIQPIKLLDRRMPIKPKKKLKV